MANDLPVTVDLRLGEVKLGTLYVSLRPAHDAGSFFINNQRGSALRVLAFRERTLLVLEAMASSKPNRVLAERVLAASLVSAGDDPELLRMALALALAGGAFDGPGFTECAQLAAKSEGWSEWQIAEAHALMVDELAKPVAAAQADDGWKRFVFSPPQSPDLDELCERMTENLLRRGMQPGAKREPEEEEESPKREVSAKLRPPGKPGAPSVPEAVATTPGPPPRLRAAFHLSPNREIHTRSVPAVQPAGIPFDAPTPAKDQASRVPTPRASAALKPVMPFAAIGGEVTLDSQALPSPVSEIRASRPWPESGHNARPAAAGWSAIPTMQASGAQAVATAGGAAVRVAEWPSTMSAPVHVAALSRTAADLRTSATHPRTATERAEDWMSELALALETECDLRGIDP